MQIKREKYVLELLRDELDSGKVCAGQNKNIIENPEFCPKDNKTRLELVWNNAAFGNILESSYLKFYKFSIRKGEFVKLYWCPKGNENCRDEIDRLSNGTRKIKDIITGLKKIKDWQNENSYVKEFFFNSQLPCKNKRRLFIYETHKKKEIRDGLHRAGALCMSIIKNHKFCPLTIFIAKENRNNIKYNHF